MRNVHFWEQHGLRKSPSIHVQTSVWSPVLGFHWEGPKEGGTEGTEATEGERAGRRRPRGSGAMDPLPWGSRPVGHWVPRLLQSLPPFRATLDLVHTLNTPSDGLLILEPRWTLPDAHSWLGLYNRSSLGTHTGVPRRLGYQILKNYQITSRMPS